MAVVPRTSKALAFPTVVSVLLILSGSFPHMCSSTSNDSSAKSFSPGQATWYGSPTGFGSGGGACGFADDVGKPPYNCLVAAGNPKLFKSGKGCGACYEIKCDHLACSGFPITVTITDECPDCDQSCDHFDLSGTAFGSLAKPSQAEELRKAGKIKIQHRRVQCHYGTDIKFKLDKGANAYYLAFLVEHTGGDGDIESVEVQPTSPSNGNWITMQRSWGQTWKADLPEGTKGPFSVRLKTLESGKTVVAKDAIPGNWFPGQKCESKLKLDD